MWQNRERNEAMKKYWKKHEERWTSQGSKNENNIIQCEGKKAKRITVTPIIDSRDVDTKRKYVSIYNDITYLVKQVLCKVID